MSNINILEIQDLESVLHEKFNSLSFHYKETIKMLEVNYCYY